MDGWSGVGLKKSEAWKVIWWPSYVCPSSSDHLLRARTRSDLIYIVRSQVRAFLEEEKNKKMKRMRRIKRRRRRKRRRSRRRRLKSGGKAWEHRRPFRRPFRRPLLTLKLPKGPRTDNEIGSSTTCFARSTDLVLSFFFLFFLLSPPPLFSYVKYT